MKSMRTISNVLIITFLAGIVFSCMPMGPTDVSNETNVVRQKYQENYNKGDAKAVSQLFTKDGKEYPPFMDMVQGQEAIQKVIKNGIDQGGVKVELETVSSQGYRNIAISDGKYKLYNTEDNLIDQGKYLTVLKKINNQWFIYYNIWNTSMPMTQPMVSDTTEMQ